MPPFLTALSLQSASLLPETWKERNNPDMPVLPACDLGPTSPAVTRKNHLPAGVLTELDRYFVLLAAYRRQADHLTNPM